MTNDAETPTTATDKPSAEKKRARKSSKPASTLASCLRAAQEQIKNVPKDGTNKFHGYDYTTAEGMIAACKHAFVTNGLTARRAGWRLRFEPAAPLGMSKAGAIAGPCCIVVSTFVVTHVDSGETAESATEYPAIPEKGRPLDKAVSGALSTGLGYWWRDALQVPRCDYEIDVGASGQYDEPEPPPPRAPAPSNGARTGTRTPGAIDRIVAHYTTKLRAAAERGADAVHTVGDEIKGDGAVDSTALRILRDEFTRCLDEAKLPRPRGTERDAIEDGGW